MKVSEIDYIYELVSKVSLLEDSDITKKGLKLNEEVGELSAEILKLVKYKSTDETPDQIQKNLLSESVDSLIMVFDIMFRLGFSKDDILKEAEEKVNKWLLQIQSK